MTPEDIAKDLPDDDDFSNNTRVVEVIRHDHRFRLTDLQRLFSELKTDQSLYAHAISAHAEGWSDDDCIVIYRSDEGELSHEEILHDLRLWLGN